MIQVSAIVLALMFPSLALAQEICDRPIAPDELVPPTDDAEFREFLNTEYQEYLRAAEGYINCLGREHQSIFEEMRAVMDRWVRYFGDDAVMHLPPGPVE